MSRILVIGFLLLCSSWVFAGAQSITALTETASPVTSTASKQAEVSDRLNPTVEHDMSEMAAARAGIYGFRLRAQTFMAELPMAWGEMVDTIRTNSPDGSILFFVKILVNSLLLFLMAEIVKAQTYSKRIVGPWFIAKQIDHPVGYTEKLPILVIRFLLGIGGTLIAMLLAFISGKFIFGPVESEAVKMTIGYTYFAYGSVNFFILLWRMILSPYLANYRIPRFHSEGSELCTKAAKKLYFWLSIEATMGISFSLFIEWLEELGVSQSSSGVLNLYLTGVMALYGIVMIVMNKDVINGAILLGRPLQEASPPNRFAVRFWAPLGIFYFIIAWLDLAYNLINGDTTLIPLIASLYTISLTVIVVYAAVSYLIEQFFQRRRRIIKSQSEEQTAELRATSTAEGLEEGEEILSGHLDEHDNSKDSLNSYEDLATRVASLLAFIAGFYALLNVWNVGLLLGPDSILDRSSDAIFILFSGYICYHFFRIWIDNKIFNEGGATVGDPLDEVGEGGAGGVGRLATLLPLFRNFLLAVIVVSVTLLALTEIGFNVAPLFAGAGVVGLAVGFGAQTLVRDVFSGAFFLFDDAFRKGEYVDIGTVKGVVERISIRSFQLRHQLGPLHTIPFGEIKFLTNFSRDWVMMKLPLRVTYDTDVEKVRKLVKKLGQRLLEDPEIGGQFLQPLKSQGVREMQDSAMIIRVKFMTKPGDQWVIRKRVYQEIRDLFIKEGIKFAHKEVTVRIADATVADLTERQKQSIAGAALLAVDEQVAGAKKAPSLDNG